MYARGDIGAAPIRGSYNSKYAFAGSNPVLTQRTYLLASIAQWFRANGC